MALIELVCLWLGLKPYSLSMVRHDLIIMDIRNIDDCIMCGKKYEEMFEIF